MKHRIYNHTTLLPSMGRGATLWQPQACDSIKQYSCSMDRDEGTPHPPMHITNTSHASMLCCHSVIGLKSSIIRDTNLVSYIIFLKTTSFTGSKTL